MEETKQNQRVSLWRALTRFKLYLEGQGRSARTIHAYDERIWRMINFFASQGRDDVSLAEITVDDMDAFAVSLRRGNLAPASVAGVIQAVKFFFRWCVEREYLSKSPARYLAKPRLDFRVTNKAIRQEDYDRLIRYVRLRENLQLEAILMFLGDTGCRVGELCSLDVTNIDFDKMEATVVGKTGERVVDFTGSTAVVLKRLLSQRDQTSGAVFRNSESQRITPNQIYSQLRWTSEKIGGIERFNPHSIRHRVGQAWLDKGANLELVRQKLGHTDIVTTANFYAHQDHSRVKIASKKFTIVPEP